MSEAIDDEDTKPEEGAVTKRGGPMTDDMRYGEVRRMSRVDLDELGEWLLERLKKVYPGRSPAQVMGFLRGACESNESCFVRTAKAVALAQIVRIPLTDDSVEERFVLAMDGGREQAANLYHHLYQFCLNSGCDCYVLSRHTDVGHNRVETRMGTLQTYPLHFIHIPLPVIPGM